MRAVGLVVRSELRRRLRGLIFVALLVALGATVTLVAVAGARRTATSFDRMQATSRTHDVLLFAGPVTAGDVRRLRAVPGVAGVGWARGFAVTLPGDRFLTTIGPLDGGLYRDVERLRIVEGRLPRPGAATEVVVGESLARDGGLHVGDVLPIRSFTQDQIDTAPADGTVPEPEGPSLRLRIVGIDRSPSDLGLQSTGGGFVILPRAFVERYGDRIGSFEGSGSALLLVRLDAGSRGVERFLPRVRSLLGDRPFDIDAASVITGGVQESVDVLAIGVAVFGAIAGLASFVAIGLVIGRQVALVAAGQGALRDLGLGRPGRALAASGTMLVAVAVGGFLAVVAAWLASPLLPIGIAGRAEPHPGRDFDATALLAGALTFTIVLVVIAVAAGMRSSRHEEPGPARENRVSALTRALEGLGGRAPTTIGVDLALGSRRRAHAVPVRSSIVGLGLAVFGIASAAVFSASLSGLLDRPGAYGRNWDVQISDDRADVDEHPCLAGAGAPPRDADLVAIARLCSLSTTFEGRAVGAVALVGLRGPIRPTVLEGRAPRTAGEVALGTETMRRFGTTIGDTIMGESPVRRARYRIVGRVVVPSGADVQALADGALLTGAGLERLNDPGNVSTSSSFVVRYREGVDVAAANRRLARRGVDLLNVAAPLEVERLRQVRTLPVVLSGFLAILGLLALGHLLLTTVQRRRRDFAVLKALGFRRAQFSATLAVQATTVAIVGLALGLVAGVLAGAAIWRATAEHVGVFGDVDVPTLVLTGIVVATVVAANVIAAFPARAASRTPAGVTLRTE